jgi:hypothetical protein
MGSRQDKAKQCSVNEYQDETEEEGIIVIGDGDVAPTFAELIANHTIPTRQEGQLTGRALLANEIPDLAIVDIEHDLLKDKADVLRRQFLDQLANLAVPVAQSAHGGLLVYCTVQFAPRAITSRTPTDASNVLAVRGSMLI